MDVAMSTEETDLTKRAREVLEGLSETARQLCLSGRYQPFDATSMRTLARLGVIARPYNRSIYRRASAAEKRMWVHLPFTDLGREVARLIAEVT